MDPLAQAPGWQGVSRGRQMLTWGHRGPSGVHAGASSVLFSRDRPWGSLLFSRAPTRKGGVSGAPCAHRPQGHPARRRGPAGQCPRPPAPLLAPSDPSPSQLPSRAVLGTPSMDWLLQVPLSTLNLETSPVDNRPTRCNRAERPLRPPSPAARMGPHLLRGPPGTPAAAAGRAGPAPASRTRQR